MFDAAARHLNFRLASEELHLTQGAVAQQIRRLEKDLTVQLFHRKARGLALTESGRSYYTSIRRALAIIEDATRKFLPDATRLTLSVTPSFASKWLVPRLSDFAHAHPEIEVQTVASEGLANFQSDGVDIAIRQGLPSTAAGLRVTLLAPLDLCAVCSPDYAKNIGASRDLETFAQLQLVQDSHNHWNALLDNAGVKARQRPVQFNQTALAMDAAANGQGIALAPKLLLGNELAAGKLVEVWRIKSLAQNGFYIVYPDSKAPIPARDTLVEWIISKASAA